MIVAGQRLPILIATRPVDFRCGHQALALMVQTGLKLDPHSGVTVIFRSKRGDRLKILVWDGTGMVLIRPLTDQNPLAHSLRPIDMTRHGWLSSRRQASQQ
jgi:transposase